MARVNRKVSLGVSSSAEMGGGMETGMTAAEIVRVQTLQTEFRSAATPVPILKASGATNVPPGPQRLT